MVKLVRTPSHAAPGAPAPLAPASNATARLYTATDATTESKSS